MKFLNKISAFALQAGGQAGVTIIFCFFFAFSANAYFNPGQPTGFVNDYTNTLNSEEKQQLENKLEQFEKETSNEISIVIIESLEGDVLENFTVELFKEWGIGKKGKDNGVLVLIAKDDKKMRIEVGYGLEGALTDAQANWIINNMMKPAFRANDFNKGINEAVEKIIAATNGEYVPSEKKRAMANLSFDAWQMIFFVAFALILWLAAILGRSKSWWLGGVLGGIVGVIIGIIKGFLFFGLITIGILIPLGLLFDFIVSKQYKATKARGSVPWWIGGGGWGSGGSSSGGFGGFGGGMSGGGGSSGSW